MTDEEKLAHANTLIQRAQELEQTAKDLKETAMRLRMELPSFEWDFATTESVCNVIRDGKELIARITFDGLEVRDGEELVYANAKVMRVTDATDALLKRGFLAKKH